MNGTMRFPGGTWFSLVLALTAVAAGAAASCAAQDAKVWRPAGTVAEDLATTTVPLVDGYAGRRPRLVFSADDRERLRKKAADHPKLWSEVEASAGRCVEWIPTPELVRSGANYWRIERVESAALSWLLTGNRRHFDAAVKWMVAHCKEDVWGDGDWRPNIDLQAAWYLYHMAIAYDILRDDLAAADRTVIRDGLASHAKAIHGAYDLKTPRVAYDQNHTYIPMTGMVAASLALLDEVPEAAEWLKLGYAVMRRCRYALGTDGYYYEGFGYWHYAMHWHVRYAELIGRATGERAFDLPVLRENWRFPLHLTLAGPPNAFDPGDTGRWSGTERTSASLINCGMFWAVASALKSAESRLVGDRMTQRWPETVYPASAFLWYDPGVEPARFDALKPYHHFTDHDVVAWRSGWTDDATCVLFRCGPLQGHAAVAKRREMTDWSPDSGHTHPDIGAFWLYAKGTALAFGTGYTGNKWTRDHNTLLVDNTGQGADGSYWNDRGFSWDRFGKVRIDRIHLTGEYAFVSGEFGHAYSPKLDPLTLRRTLAATKRWVLLADDMETGEPRRLTWICHADGPFVADGGGATARVREAALHVVPLSATATEATMQKTTVMAMAAVPGRGEPTHRGFEITYTTKEPARRVRLVNLLVPLGAGEVAPKVAAEGTEAGATTLGLRITWADSTTEDVRIDLVDRPPGEKGPVVIRK